MRCIIALDDDQLRAGFSRPWPPIAGVSQVLREIARTASALFLLRARP